MLLIVAVLVAVAARAGLASRRIALRPGLDAVAARRDERAAARGLLARIGRTPFARRLGDTNRLARRSALAGLQDRRDEVAGIRAVGGLTVTLGCLMIAMIGAPVALVALPLAAPAAIRIPELALVRMGKRRQQRIAAKVPELVELLVTTTRAGLSPAVAFHRSVGVLRGPLRDELAFAVQEMDLGVSWSRALDRLVERNDVPALRRMSVALGRSRRLGTSLATTLRSVAEDLRADRRARAEEAARRAPVKMLFPLVFLVLPAFLLLTVGPVVLATVRSLR